MATYITSDLHGDLERFKSLLKKIQFDETQDFIYILGDVVDRGDKGLELLFLIKQYMDRGVMHLIKGNHELFAQMYLENRLTATQWMLWGGIDTVREMEALTEVQSKELYGFLRGLEHYRVIDFPKHGKAILTHTGLHADYIVEFTDGTIDIVQSIEKAIQQNEFNYLVSKDLHYVPAGLIDRMNMFVIVGHVPAMAMNDDNSYKIVHKKKYMCIDTGAGHRKEGGKMSVYRMDDGAEYYI